MNLSKILLNLVPVGFAIMNFFFPISSSLFKQAGVNAWVPNHHDLEFVNNLPTPAERTHMSDRFSSEPIPSI